MRPAPPTASSLPGLPRLPIDDARVELAHRELTNVPAPKLRDAARKVWSRTCIMNRP